MKLFYPHARLAGIALACMSAASATHAADTIHTTASTGTLNWTAVTWSPTVSDWTTTAGDVVRYNGTGAASTYDLDTNVTVGGIRNGSTNNLQWTITATTGSTLTMDGTGLGAANQIFGNAGVAYIVNVNGSTSQGSVRNLDIGTSTSGVNIKMATDLDVGISGATAHSVNLYGTIVNTSGSTKTLTLRNNTTAGTTERKVTISSSIGTSGSGINIVNAGNTTKNFGAAITGQLGANVLGITQNSTVSQLVISGDNSAFVGNTIVTAGKLSLGSTYTMASGTSNALSLTGSAAPAAGTDFGQILVTAGTTTFGGSLTLNFSGTAATGPVLYDLFSTSGTGALAGSFSSVTIAGSYTASLSNSAGVWTGTTLDGLTSFSFSQATGDLTVTASAVPEPSTYAALAGLVSLGVVALRRRRA
jgi:hypothetical protein